MSIDSLKELRQQIDHIDTSLLDLLCQRTRLVEKIKERKDPNQPRIQPSREVSILRNLLRRDTGLFPKNAIIRIWREVITVLTVLQKPFSIGVYVSDGEFGLWDIARDYYGSCIEMYGLWSMEEVLREVESGGVAVGVLPYPTLENEVEPWWTWLVHGGMPRVVTRLPFYDYGNARVRCDGLSIASLVLEESGYDRTLIRLETGEVFLEGDVERYLGPYGLMGSIISRWRSGTHTFKTLLEVDGFFESEDTRLGLLSREMVMSVIGSYAVPARIGYT